MRRSFLSRLPAYMAVLVIAVTATHAHAVSYSWTPKTGSGDWTTSVNWSGTSGTNLYPGSTMVTDTAFLDGDLTGNMTVNLDTSVSLDYLFLGDRVGATGPFTTTLSTANGSTLTFANNTTAGTAGSGTSVLAMPGGVQANQENTVSPNIFLSSPTLEFRFPNSNSGAGINARVNLAITGDVTSALGATGSHVLRFTPLGSTTNSSYWDFRGNITNGPGTLSILFRTDMASSVNTLKLTGTGNTFTGGISFLGGKPNASILESSPASGTNGALGTGLLLLGNSGSSATLNLGGSLSTVTEVCAINIPGPGTVAKRIAVIGAGNRILSGTVNQNASAGLTLACSSAGNLTLSNTLSGTGPITIDSAGAGMVIFGGSNTYTGTTTVTNGAFRLDGSLDSSSGISVAAAGWLGGTGTASGTATVSGTLSPGASAGTAGLLSLGSLTLTSTTKVTAIDLLAAGTRGTAYDGISILNAGGLTYGGTMALAFGGSMLPDSTTFNVFSFTGATSGSFAQLRSTGYYAGTWTNNVDGTYPLAKDAQTVTFTPSTGNVVVVPEPASVALVAAGLVAGVACRRQRRRASGVRRSSSPR